MLVGRDLTVAPPGAREPVLQRMSITLERGEWVALAGPNGGGKSTLLHALAGLWPPSHGRVELDGAEVSLHAASRGRIALVLQDPSNQILQPTVREELAFAGRNLGIPTQRLADNVRRLTRALGLEVDLARDPVTLSAGQQQLLLLVSALAAEPAVLLADEPAAHLDAEARRRVLALVREEARAGLTVGWVTQEPGEWSQADRVVWIGERTARTPPLPHAPFASGGEGIVTITVEVPPPGQVRKVSVRERTEIELRRGEVTALVGANAVGKSLVLGAVAGLEPLAQVAVGWRRPPDPPPIVALQYPELQIFEEVVGDELVFAAVSRGVSRTEARARATTMMEFVGLDAPRFLTRRTWTLSSGEKRLIGLIAALISPASLVILDEPTAGLDPVRRERVASLLRERADSDPILVATQDEEWIAEVGVSRVELG